MKKFFFVSSFILLFIAADFIFIFSNKTLKANTNFQNDSSTTITITVVGDLMCHSIQFNYAKIGKDSFDFNPVYGEVKKYFEESDFVFGNLETVTAGKVKGFSGYPFFNSPDEFISALANSGFNLLTTSNNHSLDRGEEGVLRTIEQIKKNGINYNGTFTSKEDRDSIRVFNIKGIKIAFLAYSYGTNGVAIPKGKTYLINLINYQKIKNDIDSAKKLAIDLILVHYHFGEEYKREPNSFQMSVVDSTIKYGADIIIGGHPHVIEPVNFFKSNSSHLDSAFAAYSMGNFISNQRWRYSDAGLILNINLTKNFSIDSVFIADVNFIPTWVFKGETENGNEYIILPSEYSLKDSLPSYLDKDDIEKMKQSFYDTKDILIKYTSKIKLKNIK